MVLFAGGRAPLTVLDDLRDRGWQRPTLKVAGVCWFIFALVAVLAVGREGNSLDRAFLEASPGTTSWNLARVMLHMRELGNIRFIGPVAIILAAVALFRPQTRSAAVFASCTFFSGVLVGTGLKYLFGQSGPPVQSGTVAENGTAFPSGHTLVATLFFGSLAGFAAGFVHRRMLPLLVTVWEAAALGVGSCQILLRTHWLSDVVAGWFFAVGWLLLCSVAISEFLVRTAPTGGKHRSGAVVQAAPAAVEEAPPTPHTLGDDTDPNLGVVSRGQS